MSFLQRLKNKIKKKFRKSKITIDPSEIDVGDIIKIKFKDPRKYGLVDGGQTAYSSRFNRDEIENCEAVGTVCRIERDPPVPFLEIGVVKWKERQLRMMVFFMDEIEEAYKVL